MTLPVNEQIGPYKIIEQQGTGGMATVYRAYHERLDRDVAIKLMHRGFLQDPQFHARFEREARIVARLEHPSIVPVYDYDEYEGQPFLVMKFIAGQTLKDRLRKGALPLDEILDLMPKMADALDYAHERGILHRDIKPSNILIDETGRPYLTDFGLARITQAGESSISADTMLGTPHYMSPEQAQGVPDIDHRTDIYSFGVILYELVTGAPPFGGETAYAVIHKHIYAAPPDPVEVNSEVPPDVARVLVRALEKAPADRFSSADALMQAFQQAVAMSGLTKLDESRISMASQSLKSVNQRTPGGGTYSSVNQADGSPQAPDLPISDRFGVMVNDVAKRVAEVVQDFGRTMESSASRREFAENLRRELRSDDDTGSRKRKAVVVGPGTKTRGSSNKAKRAAAAISSPVDIEEEWRAEEDEIRRRVQKRIRDRGGFILHAGIFGIVMILTFFGQSGSQNAIREGIGSSADTAFFAPMVGISPALLLLFWWGAGVLAHGTRVFFNTGFFADRQQVATQRTMSRIYGDDWQQTARPGDYRKIRRTVENRANRAIGLITHAITAFGFWLGVAVIWEPVQQTLQNLFAGDAAMLAVTAELPVIELTFGFMVLTLMVHALVVVLGMIGGAEARERAIQREIARSGLRSPSIRSPRQAVTGDHPFEPLETPDEKTKNETAQPPIRLTGDGEFTESFVDDIADQQRNQRG